MSSIPLVPSCWVKNNWMVGSKTVEQLCQNRTERLTIQQLSTCVVLLGQKYNWIKTVGQIGSPVSSFPLVWSCWVKNNWMVGSKTIELASWVKNELAAVSKTTGHKQQDREKWREKKEKKNKVVYVPEQSMVVFMQHTNSKRFTFSESVLLLHSQQMSVYYVHIIIICNRVYCIHVPGHDPLILFFRSFLFLIGWVFYGPNYLRC